MKRLLLFILLFISMDASSQTMKIATYNLRYANTTDIPHISDKMLTTQLRELEEDGYIKRKVYAVVPPKTEYSLTPKGKDVMKLITTIRNYGLKIIEQQKN